jgi:hypothetical protein
VALKHEPVLGEAAMSLHIPDLTGECEMEHVAGSGEYAGYRVETTINVYTRILSCIGAIRQNICNHHPINQLMLFRWMLL